jgi:hypothetical protein
MEVKKGSNKALDESINFKEKTEPLGEICISLGKRQGSSRAVVQVAGTVYIEGTQIHFFSEVLRPDIKTTLADSFIYHLMQEAPRMLMNKKVQGPLCSYGFMLSDNEGNRLADDDPIVEFFYKELLPSIMRRSLPEQASSEGSHH